MENIRNGFVRNLKQWPSDTSSKAKNPYYWHDVMKFLLNNVKLMQYITEAGSISPSQVLTDCVSLSNEYSQLKDIERPKQPETQRDEISTNCEPSLLTNTN